MILRSSSRSDSTSLDSVGPANALILKMQWRFRGSSALPPRCSERNQMAYPERRLPAKGARAQAGRAKAVRTLKATDHNSRSSCSLGSGTGYQRYQPPRHPRVLAVREVAQYLKRTEGMIRGLARVSSTLSRLPARLDCCTPASFVLRVTWVPL